MLAIKQLPDIGIQVSGEVLFIPQSEILYILAEGSYCRVALHDKRRFTLARKLGDVEKSLPDSFLRVHHSHIINLLHVVRFVKNENGYLVMSDGEELPVSKQRRKALLERFRIL